MITDQFYESIVKALKGHLDPDLFELCVCDLLSKDFPGIAPIQGGMDAGMDGGIPNGEGEPYPLVCTTSTESATNLRKNLRSYIAAGRLRRKVVFATSRFLTPRQIQGLYDVAKKNHFILHQAYDGTAIALKLYNRPVWCSRLLGLTGNPPALSIIPKSRRPVIGDIAIGRSADLDWLREMNSDRVLVGQPGSGKTFLLHLLALKGWGLFAISENRCELANEIRSKEPSIIIVDDAHVNSALLTTLLHMRTELGAAYHLLATCWPGGIDQVRSILNATENQTRLLQPLSRDSMVEVVKQAGLKGPTHLIREIITQSVGKPGLAVTIADLCLKGGQSTIKELLGGKIVTREIANFFRPIMGRSVIEILASFAVGGRTGVRFEAVSEFLSVGSVDLRHQLADLNHGGVVQVHDNDCISVIPPALRYSLVKEAFFTKPGPLDVKEILPYVVSPGNALGVLVAVRALGGDVSIDLIRTLVQEIDDSDAWSTYAELGPDQVREALKSRPQFLGQLTNVGLFHNPELTTTLLLDAGKDDIADLNSKPAHPLRQVQDWIKSAVPGTDTAIERRRIVLAAIRKFIDSGGDVRSAIHALSFVFNPHAEWTESDPGSGATLTIFSAILTLSELKELAGVWHDAKHILEKLDIQDWPSLFEMLDSLMHPYIAGRKVPGNVHAECKRLSKIIIKDLANMAKGKIGVLARLSQQARRIGCDLNFQLDNRFCVLYPDQDFDDNWREHQAEQQKDVEALAESWKARPIKDVADDIVRLEKAAQIVSWAGWPRWPVYLCHKLSKTADDIELWIDSLMNRDAAPDLVEQFVRRYFEISGTLSADVIGKLVGHARYRGVGISAVLKIMPADNRLLGLVWEGLGQYSGILETMIIRNEIPEETIILLLQHQDPEIAEKTARAAWEVSPNHKISDSIYQQWTKAVLRTRPEQHFLPRILESDQALAFEWLKSHLGAQDVDLFSHDDAFGKMIAALNKPQKQELLSGMKDASVYRSSNIITSLIGSDNELFKMLLSRSELKDYHLKPLERCSEEALPKMIRAALEYYDIKKVALSILGHAWSWHGKASDYWKGLLKKYERWKDHPDEMIRQVARELTDITRQWYESALERERREEVYGFDTE
jgi:hypothetical protein